MKFANTTTSYNRYVRNNKEDYKKYLVYRDVIHDFNEFMVKKLLEGFWIDLSGGNSLGTIGVTGTRERPRVSTVTDKIIGLSPNWGATKKYRDETGAGPDTVIYNTNEHSGGIRYKLVWHNSFTLTRNKIYYNLVFARHVKRSLQKSILEGTEYYVKIKRQRYGIREEVNNQNNVEESKDPNSPWG